MIELIVFESVCECGGKLILESENYTVCQVIDAEKVSKIVIEYRQYKKYCELFGKIYTESFPENVSNTVVYGGNLKAYLTYLSQYQMITLKRTTELMYDLFDVKIS